MDAWLLILFLGYTTGKETQCLDVGATSETIQFYHRHECEKERDAWIAAYENAGFKRYVVRCSKRSGPLVEPMKDEDKKGLWK